MQHPKLRIGLQPAVAADRRQPVLRDLHLQPDQRAGAALRRALGDGRHRRAGAAAWSSCCEARGGALRCNAEVQAHRRSDERPRHRRRAGRRRAPRGRHRGQQRRHRLDLPPPGRAAAPPHWTDQRIERRPLLDEPVRLVLRHQPAVRRRAAPHDGAGPALRGAADGHLQAPPRWPTTSASTCTAPPPPTPAWRRPATTPSTRCRRCRTWTAAPTGRPGRALPPAHRAALHDTVLPGLGAHIVSSRVTTPQDFHDRLLSYKGAAFGMEPLLQQSA